MCECAGVSVNESVRASVCACARARLPVGECCHIESDYKHARTCTHARACTRTPPLILTPTCRMESPHQSTATGARPHKALTHSHAGWTPLTNLLLPTHSHRVRGAAALAMGTAVKNEPQFQLWLLDPVCV